MILVKESEVVIETDNLERELIMLVKALENQTSLQGERFSFDRFYKKFKNGEYDETISVEMVNPIRAVYIDGEIIFI